MKLLALDQASKTGWAYGDVEGPVKNGFFTTGKPKMEPGEFCLAFYANLEKLCEEHPPSVIAFERPVVMSGKINFVTLRKLYSMATMIEIYGIKNDIPVTEVHQAQAKKLAYGRGKGKPDNAVELINEWTIDCSQADAADAAAVWLKYVETLHPKTFARWCERRGAS